VAQELRHPDTRLMPFWTFHVRHKGAQIRAEDLEWEAGFAIDYAIASIEQTRFAVLDATEARQAAEQAKAA
jgi:hypothetical protein